MAKFINGPLSKIGNEKTIKEKKSLSKDHSNNKTFKQKSIVEEYATRSHKESFLINANIFSKESKRKSSNSSVYPPLFSNSLTKY